MSGVERMDEDHKTIPGHHSIVDTVREKKDKETIYSRKNGTEF